VTKIRIELLLPVHDGYHQFRHLVGDLCDVSLQWPSGLRLTVMNDKSGDARVDRLITKLEENCAIPIRVLHHSTQQGFIRSVNEMATKAGRGAQLLILNSDIRFDPAIIPRMSKWLDRDNKIASVTPLSDIHTVKLVHGEQSMRRIPLTFLEINSCLGRLKAREVCYIPSGLGFCLLIRRSAWLETGGLWNKLGLGYLDDIEWSVRASLRGWSHALAYDCYVSHFGSASFGKATRQKWIARNFAIVQKRHRFLLDFLHKQNDTELIFKKWSALLIMSQEMSRREGLKGIIAVDFQASLQTRFRFQLRAKTIWTNIFVLRRDLVDRLVRMSQTAGIRCIESSK
jgi:GT2 family glycosyltransferase